jgi:hypothetical protein
MAMRRHASGYERQKERSDMTYRVFSGPPGTETIPPMEKDRWLFKEFAVLDDALGWARHVGKSGNVALLIEGDDGTRLGKHQIAAVLHTEESRKPEAH